MTFTDLLEMPLPSRDPQPLRFASMADGYTWTPPEMEPGQPGPANPPVLIRQVCRNTFNPSGTVATPPEPVPLKFKSGPVTRRKPVPQPAAPVKPADILPF